MHCSVIITITKASDAMNAEKSSFHLLRKFALIHTIGAIYFISHMLYIRDVFTFVSLAAHTEELE